MYLENKNNLEIELSQASAQVHQGSLRTSEAVAGNFGELRLLQGLTGRRETQKLQQSAVIPSTQCVIHAEDFVPVRQEAGYASYKSLLYVPSMSHCSDEHNC